MDNQQKESAWATRLINGNGWLPQGATRHLKTSRGNLGQNRPRCRAQVSSTPCARIIERSMHHFMATAAQQHQIRVPLATGNSRISQVMHVVAARHGAPTPRTRWVSAGSQPQRAPRPPTSVRAIRVPLPPACGTPRTRPRRETWGAQGHNATFVFHNVASPSVRFV